MCVWLAILLFSTNPMGPVGVFFMFQDLRCHNSLVTLAKNYYHITQALKNTPYSSGDNNN